MTANEIAKIGERLDALEELLEHEGFAEFLPYAKMAAAEAKLSAARRLVWRTYRQLFIVFAGGVVAVVTLWEKAASGIGAFLRWAIGQ